MIDNSKQAQHDLRHLGMVYPMLTTLKDDEAEVHVFTSPTLRDADARSIIGSAEGEAELLYLSEDSGWLHRMHKNEGQTEIRISVLRPDQ